MANAPLGTKPPSKIQKLNSPSKIQKFNSPRKIHIFQIFPRRPLHEVSRTAAAEVEPTETSRRSSRRRLSDQTLPPPRSIRYQISVRNLLKSNRRQILENLTLPCYSLPTLSRCTGQRLVFYLLHVTRGEHCVSFLSLLVFVGFCSFVFFWSFSKEGNNSFGGL